MSKDEGQREYELCKRLREATDRRWGGLGQRGRVCAVVGPPMYYVEELPTTGEHIAKRSEPGTGEMTETDERYDDPVEAYRAIRDEEATDER